MTKVARARPGGAACQLHPGGVAGAATAPKGKARARGSAARPQAEPPGWLLLDPEPWATEEEDPAAVAEAFFAQLQQQPALRLWEGEEPPPAVQHQLGLAQRRKPRGCRCARVTWLAEGCDGLRCQGRWKGKRRTALSAWFEVVNKLLTNAHWSTFFGSGLAHWGFETRKAKERAARAIAED